MGVCLDLVEQGYEFGSVGKLNVLVVGEVEFEFEEAGEVKQYGSKGVHLAGDASSELAHG